MHFYNENDDCEHEYETQLPHQHHPAHTTATNTATKSVLDKSILDKSYFIPYRTHPEGGGAHYDVTSCYSKLNYKQEKRQTVSYK